MITCFLAPHVVRQETYGNAASSYVRAGGTSFAKRAVLRLAPPIGIANVTLRGIFVLNTHSSFGRFGMMSRD